MAVTDQNARVRALVAASLERQALGQDFSYDVAMVLAPGAAGLVISYTIVVTMRNPLLGRKPLGQVSPITSPEPTEDQVDAVVTALLKNLRAERARVLAGGNGHATAGRPGT